MTKEFVNKALKPILLRENLKEHKISVSGGSEKGDGYMGEIIFAEVVGKDEKKQEKVYKFVVKCAKASKNFKEIMPIHELFENEKTVYSEIFPIFKSFQDEKKVKNPFDGVAKCYGVDVVDDREIIVLENLKVKGYDLHDRKKGMNEAHIKTVLEMYGKYHAVSFALRDQKPKKFVELNKKIVDMTGKRKPPPKGAFNMFQQIIDIAQKEGEKEVAQACIKLGEGEDRAFMASKDLNDPYNVILHGDCWNNNFLFKYEGDRDNPITVCLLDFQFSRLGSVVNDLSNFLFTTLTEDTVQQFDEFVDYYYAALTSAITALGSDPKKLFPREKLLEHWKEHAVSGLSIMPLMVKFCVSDSDEVVDFAEAAEQGKGPDVMFSKQVKNEDDYKKRTLPIVKLAIKKGFIEC